MHASAHLNYITAKISIDAWKEIKGEVAGLAPQA